MDMEEVDRVRLKLRKVMAELWQSIREVVDDSQHEHCGGRTCAVFEKIIEAESQTVSALEMES